MVLLKVLAMRFILASTLLVAFLNSACTTTPKKGLQNTVQGVLCDSPLYSQSISPSEGYSTYFDYDQALACAREQNKVLVVFFTSWSACGLCDKVRRAFLEHDSTIRERIQSYCVLVVLYCDDKGVDTAGDILGKKNLKIQVEKFKSVEQPYFYFLNKNEEVIGQTGYCNNLSFLKILERAIELNRIQSL